MAAGSPRRVAFRKIFLHGMNVPGIALARVLLPFALDERQAPTPLKHEIDLASSLVAVVPEAHGLGERCIELAQLREKKGLPDSSESRLLSLKYTFGVLAIRFPRLANHGSSRMI
jgi:hypothetical protein